MKNLISSIKLMPLLFLTVLTACHQPTPLTACRLYLDLAAPGRAPSTIDHVQSVINVALLNTSISGWTLYPAYGAWRNDSSKPFERESSVVIELIGDKTIIDVSHALGKSLEKTQQQELVLVYCTP